MAISFCKKCKNILPPQSSEILSIKCPSCGFEQGPKKNMILRDKIKKKTKKGTGAANDENIYASYDNVCPKCGHNKAQIIDIGIKYSDEDNLIFLKCGKCGFSERIGRKVS